jgi:hypothetical protein
MSDTTIIAKENGRYSLAPLQQYMDNVIDGIYRIEVRKVRKARTLDQNGWLFGCIYPLLLQGLHNEGWEFTTTDEVHEFFKALFRKRKCINKHTGEVVEIESSTANMDTITFSEYCEQLRDYGREFLNIEIPDPDKLWRDKK